MQLREMKSHKWRPSARALTEEEKKTTRRSRNGINGQQQQKKEIREFLKFDQFEY